MGQRSSSAVAANQTRPMFLREAEEEVDEEDMGPAVASDRCKEHDRQFAQGACAEGAS